MKSVFEKRLEEGVKPPVLPQKTIELLPFPASADDPQPPQATHVVRAVLFVDCVGNEPLRVYGLPLENEQSNAALKDLMAKAALPNKVSLDPEFLGGS